LLERLEKQRQKKTLDIKKATNTIVILPQERSCSAKNQNFFSKKYEQDLPVIPFFFSNDTFLNQKSPSLTRDKHKNQPRNSLQSLCKNNFAHLTFSMKRKGKCNHIIQEEEKKKILVLAQRKTKTSLKEIWLCDLLP